jgi:hypothetical protein
MLEAKPSAADDQAYPSNGSLNMPISQLSNNELSQIEHNLIFAQSPDEPYDLISVLCEKNRRAAPNFDGRDLTRLILALSRNSQDQFVSYKDLWEHCYPNVGFKGNNRVKEIMRILGISANYCMNNRYPIVTSIVVRKGDRKNTDKAKKNMREAARMAGVQPLYNTPEEFVDAHSNSTLQMSLQQIL